MKIDEAPPIANPDGTEIVPVSASGAAASVTLSKIAALARSGVPAADLAALIAALAPAATASTADSVPLLRSGAALRVPLSALAALFAAAPGEASALVGADLVRLRQSGNETEAPLSALASFVLASLPAAVAAWSAASPQSSDTLLLARAAGGATLLRRLTLSDLAAWLATGESEAQSAPGVLVRTATETLQAGPGAIAVNLFDIPAGARLLALRARVDDALSVTRLAENAEEGATPSPVAVSPVLSCGAASLPVPAAAASAPALLPALALPAAPASSFTLGVTEETGYEYTYSGSLRVSATWEEPAALAALPAS